MARSPLQILILPFRQAEKRLEYAVFSRADDECWQGIAGGGEDDETPLEAARREALEEAGVPPAARFVELQTRSSVPVTCFRESASWGEELYVVTEHCYGVEMQSGDIQLSGEHRAYRWVDYDTAFRLLTYDGNKTALWELNQRLLGLGPRAVPGKPLPEGSPAR